MLTACAGSTDAPSFAQLAKGVRKFVDHAVRVRGMLLVRDSGCTQQACVSKDPSTGQQTPIACCNQCSARLALTDEQAASAASVPKEFGLSDQGGLGDFVCHGDESMVCCPVEPRIADVMVQGTLKKAEGAEERYEIQGARLCLL